MPMNLTQYWENLEQDVNHLQRVFGDFYQTYAPVTAALQMAASGKTLESASTTAMSGIQSTIQQHERGIGSRLEGEVRLPAISNPQELLFAVIYFKHQNRFDEVDSVSSLINNGIRFIAPGLQSRKPEIRRVAGVFLASINAYYTDNQQAIHTAFPQLNNAPGETIIEKVTALLVPPAPVIQDEAQAVDATVTLGTLENLVTVAVRQQFDEIVNALPGIEQIGPDQTAVDLIVQNLNNHFRSKETLFNQLGHAKGLKDALPTINLANLDDSPLVTEFLSQLTDTEKAEWDRIKTPVAPDVVVEEAPAPVDIAPHKPTVRQQAGAWGQWGWSLVTGAVESVGGLLVPIAPTIASNAVSGMYRFGKNLTENVTSAVANYTGFTPLASQSVTEPAVVLEAPEVKIKRELTEFVTNYHTGKAQELVTQIPDMTLDVATQTSAEEILRVKDKLEVLNSVLVLDKQMEAYIEKHNKGLIKFIDFFKPINDFLKSVFPFITRVMHDKALLIEEARAFKASLAGIQQSLNEPQTTESLAQVKDSLNQLKATTRGNAQDIRDNNLYLFIRPQDKTAAKQAAQELDATLDGDDNPAPSN